MGNILLVEDSPEIVQMVNQMFAQSGINVISAGTISEAWSVLTRNIFSLVIMDIMLPDGNGFELVAKIRAAESFRDIHILFLSVKEEISAKLSAFSLGADDYVVKPFNPLELKARIESRLRKISSQIEKEDYAIGPFAFHAGSQRICIKDDNADIGLTPREFKIFYFLAKKPDIIFSREKLLSKMSSSSVHVTDRTIDTQICTLRKKLGSLGKYIESITGEGYRFNPNPRGI